MECVLKSLQILDDLITDMFLLSRPIQDLIWSPPPFSSPSGPAQQGCSSGSISLEPDLGKSIVSVTYFLNYRSVNSKILFPQSCTWFLLFFSCTQKWGLQGSHRHPWCPNKSRAHLYLPLGCIILVQESPRYWTTLLIVQPVILQWRSFRN